MRPLRFTIGTGMLAVAIVAVACAGLLLLAQTWGLLSEFIAASSPDLNGFNGMGVALALVVTLPWLLVWLGLRLSGLWTKVPGLSKKSANLDCNDL